MILPTSLAHVPTELSYICDLPAAIFQAFKHSFRGLFFVCFLCAAWASDQIILGSTRRRVALSLSLTQGMACIGDITVCTGRWADVEMEEACADKLRSIRHVYDCLPDRTR